MYHHRSKRCKTKKLSINYYPNELLYKCNDKETPNKEEIDTTTKQQQQHQQTLKRKKN